jgi:hypothetical protein
MAEGKPLQAIPSLREDFRDACSMELLVKAYEQSGDRKAATAQRERLVRINLPTIETAMVAPQYRTTAAR